MLPLMKFNPRLLTFCLAASTLTLRVTCLITAFEYAGRNVGICYVDNAVGLWTTMQQFMSAMMIGATVFLGSLARKHKDMII